MMNIIEWELKSGMSEVFKWFNDAGHTDFIASLLSIAAIIVSILAFIKSQKTQNRLVEIEEAREQDRLAEKKKANLTAQIMRDERGRLILRIENKGLGEARDIRVWLDDKQISDHPVFVKGQEEIFVVGPQSYFQYLIAITSSCPCPSGIAIAWADDSGEVGSYRNSLTF